MYWPERLSFNDMVAGTHRHFDEVVYEAAKASVAGLGLHIHLIEDFGVEKAIKLVRDTGIPISNYSAVGHWSSGIDYRARPRTLASTIQKLDDAVAFGTDIVGVTAGRQDVGDKDLRGARARTVEGIAELLPYARERNIRLAIEPTHPIFGRNAPVLPTLHHTLDIIDEIGDDSLGVLLDLYHLWWEHDLAEQLQRAGDRVYIIQVADWDPEMVARNWNYRALTGQGCIDYSVYLDNLKGFDGWWDYEGINDEVAPTMSLPEMFEKIAATFQETIGQYLPSQTKK